MHTTALTGLAAFATVTIVGLTVSNNLLLKSDVQYHVASFKEASVTMAVPKVVPAPKTIQYKVAYRDTIGAIADKYHTTWQRIYNKNTAMQGPSDLTTGQEIVIPTADEALKDRPIPSFIVVSHTDLTEAQAAAQAAEKAALAAAKQASAVGNQYAPGNCTWYVKSKRADLPNNLGNAYTWAARARSQGLVTGTAPRPGAVGQRGNHVVYVEGVNSDGTVAISEMNFAGLYKITRRTLPANYFTYIY